MMLVLAPTYCKRPSGIEYCLENNKTPTLVACCVSVLLSAAKAFRAFFKEKHNTSLLHETAKPCHDLVVGRRRIVLLIVLFVLVLFFGWFGLGAGV